MSVFRSRKIISAHVWDGTEEDAKVILGMTGHRQIRFYYSERELTPYRLVVQNAVGHDVLTMDSGDVLVVDNVNDDEVQTFSVATPSSFFDQWEEFRATEVPKTVHNVVYVNDFDSSVIPRHIIDSMGFKK